MKKFFDRLRRWIIKKLGGFTEQFEPLQREITGTTVVVRKIRANISVDRTGLDGADGFKRYCETRVMEAIMRDLYRSGFILWERQDDIEQKVSVRATLYVVDANDLEPRFQFRGGVRYGY